MFYPYNIQLNAKNMEYLNMSQSFLSVVKLLNISECDIGIFTVSVVSNTHCVVSLI